MLATIAARLGQMLFVMFGVSVLVFLIFFATPGADPAARIAGRDATPATLAAVRHDFGLDRPLPVQYLRLMRRLFVTGDLTSFVNRGERVVPAIAEAAPVTLSLVCGAGALMLAGGLATGTLAAAARGTILDRALMAAGLIGVSLPVFWVAEIANLITQDRLHSSWMFAWVPPLGYQPLSRDPASWFLALVIPWVTLAILYIGLYGRVLRTALIEIYQQDFIRTARAKGISETRILLRHALPSAAGGVLAMFGLDLGALIGGGALLTEVVFGLPGIGKLTYDALQSLDLPMIMATVMYAAFFVVAANTAVDIGHAFLDPRLRDGG